MSTLELSFQIFLDSSFKIMISHLQRIEFYWSWFNHQYCYNLINDIFEAVHWDITFMHLLYFPWRSRQNHRKKLFNNICRPFRPCCDNRGRGSGGNILKNGWDLYLFQRFPKLCGYKYYVNKTFLKMQRVERPELSRSWYSWKVPSLLSMRIWCMEREMGWLTTSNPNTNDSILGSRFKQWTNPF